MASTQQVFAGVNDVSIITHVAVYKPHEKRAGSNKARDKDIQTLVHVQLPNLTTLDLSGGSKFSEKAIISAIVPTLRKINLTDCRKITDTTIEKIATTCSKITHLRLSICPKLTDQSLKYLGEHCKELQYLHLAPDFARCLDGKKILESVQQLEITPDVIMQLTPVVLMAIGKPYTRAKEKISTLITLQGLKEFVEKCKSLKVLYVPSIKETDSDIVGQLIYKGQNPSPTMLALMEMVSTENLQILDYEENPDSTWKTEKVYTVPN